MTMHGISREFELAVMCCRAAFASRSADRPGDAVRNVDWQRFLDLIRFHRVEGLVWGELASSVSQLPSAIADSIGGDARVIAATNLAILAECKALSEAFAEAGVPLLFLKGLAVAALAYGTPLLKRSWDVDLLTDPQMLAQASDLLRRRGYRLVFPPPSANLQRWHARSKESVWVNDSGVHVELHTRLADNRALIPTIGIVSNTQIVEFEQGTKLTTLATDELFAYLCVHGASSAWFRLKWITDVAGLLSGLDPQAIERLYIRSQQLGASRAADQALLLADALYGSLDGTSLKDRLTSDRISRWLAAMALRQLAVSTIPREPTKVPLGTWRIHLTQLFLRPGLRFAAGEFVRQISGAAHRN